MEDRAGEQVIQYVEPCWQDEKDIVVQKMTRICRKREKAKSDYSSSYLYDAFISFNEGDHDLVYDHLAPQLEDRHGIAFV